MAYNDLCHGYVYSKKWMKSHTGMGHYITFQVWGYKKYDVLSACGQKFEWDTSTKEPEKKCKKCAKYEAKLRQKEEFERMAELASKYCDDSFCADKVMPINKEGSTVFTYGGKGDKTDKANGVSEKTGRV